MRTCLIALVGSLIGASTAVASDPPTFYKDVLPILQANCQSCHRPGEVAPMSLVTYEQARPWARAIKTATVSRQMPPWFADPSYGHFANQRRLSNRDIETLSAWVDNGAPAGNEAEAPPAVTFPSGWNITPDVIVEMPKPFEVPARGTVNYKYILVKTNFKEDMWVTAAEMRPGDPAVLHHGKVWVRPPGSTWMEKAVPGEAYESETQRHILGKNAIEEGNDILGKFNPGLGAQRFDQEGAAKFVPKGSDLVYELHYTTSGKPSADVSKLGLVLAKEPPQKRYFFHAGPTALNLAIPAGNGKAEVVSEITFGEDAKLVYAQPHMHVRGKDFELRVVSPSGESTTVLKGDWNFEWQMGYQYAEPIVLPKGSKLRLISHFDNSTANRYNPDPAKKVVWGPQNWDEMSNCFIGVLFGTATSPEKVFLRSGPSLLPRGEEGPTLESVSRVDPNAVAAATNGNINANVAPAGNGGPENFDK
ncbi:MAG TPA: cytochrome c [Vicinamibacterales bacterium]|nr:cytochrome c [Vicinamibacterales bacterium]